MQINKSKTSRVDNSDQLNPDAKPMVSNQQLHHVKDQDRHKKKKILIAGAIVLLLIVGLSAYLLHDNDSTPDSANNYLLAGSAKGQGMSFDRYDIFGIPTSTKGLPLQVSFVQTQKLDTKKSSEVARLSALIRDMSNTASSTTAGGPSPEYAQTLRKNLIKNPSDPDYQLATRAIAGFAKSSFGGEVLVTLGPAKPLTTDNIKKDAWQFSVSAVGNSFDNVIPQKGTMVVAIGKKSYYYFIVTATDSYMSKNSGTISKILASEKIDQ